MPEQRDEELSGGGVPDPRCVILAGSRDALAVARELDIDDPARRWVAAALDDRSARRRIEDAQVVVARGEPGPIWGEGAADGAERRPLELRDPARGDFPDARRVVRMARPDPVEAGAVGGERRREGVVALPLEGREAF